MIAISALDLTGVPGVDVAAVTVPVTCILDAVGIPYNKNTSPLFSHVLQLQTTNDDHTQVDEETALRALIELLNNEYKDLLISKKKTSEKELDMLFSLSEILWDKVEMCQKEKIRLNTSENKD